jgi:hypothetical protein
VRAAELRRWRWLSGDVRERGIAALAADLESGAWAARHAGVRQLTELELGYRLVVGRAP